MISIKHWYVYVYLAIAACVVYFASQPIAVHDALSKQETARYEATFEPLSLEETVLGMDYVRDQIQFAHSWTPDDYFKLLSLAYEIERTTRRSDFLENESYVASDGKVNTAAHVRLGATTLDFDLTGARDSSSPWRNYSKAEIDAARDRSLVGSPLERDLSNRVSFLPFWIEMTMFYLKVSALMFIFFVIRLWRNEKLHATEFVMPDLYFWCLAWPIGLFKYPVYVDPLKQINRARRWVFATVGALFAMSPLSFAQSKSASKLSLEGDQIEWVMTAEQAEVEDPMSNVIRVEFPKEKTRKLPDVIMGPLDNETRVSVLGWSHAEWSENVPFDVTSARVRLIAANDTAGWQFWSQFELNRLDQPIDAFRIGKRFSTGWRVEGGRNFASAIDAVPAPFLLESVTGPRIPVDFFRTGLKAYGPVSDNVTVGFDVTGRGGTDAFDPAQFDTLNASGFIKYQHGDGLLRLSVQEAGDTRFVADFTHDLDWLQVRGALHYRMGTDTAGGYMFAKREFSERVIGFVQIDRVGKDTQALAGVGINLGDHAELTVEVANDVNVRLRKRF